MDGSHVSSATIMQCYPFNKIRPCLVKDGQVVGYLKKDNFEQFEDGTTADITSGDAGDVMIEIPRFYYSAKKEGTVVDIRISGFPHEGFVAYPFYRGAKNYDCLYVGAYQGYVDSAGMLRSLSGKTPTLYARSTGIETMRQTAQKQKGLYNSGYELMSFYTITAIEILFTFFSANASSSTMFGTGWNYFAPQYSPMKTGIFNTQSYFTHRERPVSVSKGSGSYMRFLGIENIYGNGGTWVDGMSMYDTTAVLTLPEGTTKTLTIANMTGGSDFYITSILGRNEAPFLPSSASGEAGKVYSDVGYSSVYAVRGLPKYGNYGTGIHSFNASYDPSAQGTLRLCMRGFLKK